MITWVPYSVGIFYAALRAAETGGKVIVGLTDDGSLVLGVVAGHDS
jgi:hypothetical protein